MSTILSTHTHSFQTRKLLSSVSYVCLTLAVATTLSSPVHAANFTASNEAELVIAIDQANASGDARSTITLTGSFALSGSTPLPAASGNITIDTATYTLSTNRAAPIKTTSSGLITITGTISGPSSGDIGQLPVSGDGTVVLSGVKGTLGSAITVASGTVRVENGSQININGAANNGVVNITRDTATVVISGSNTALTTTAASATSTIGVKDGMATLTVEKGATFTGKSLQLGNTAYTNGTINVDGTNSQLNAAVIQNTAGNSYINITNGGSLNATSAYFGGQAAINRGGVGIVNISGKDSTFTTVSQVYLFNGSMSITDGGSYKGTSLQIALDTNTKASVFISGENSQILTTTPLGGVQVGTKGEGSLTIADGAKVTSGGSLLVATNASGTGTINIGGEAGKAATRAGTIEAAAIQFGLGNGTLNFNHTDTDYAFDIALKGNGSVNQTGSGKTVFNTDQSGFTGKTLVSAGTLAVNNTLGGTMTVTGGRLQGVGKVGATVNETGGVIAPGNDILGTLTIDGNYEGKGGIVAIRTALGDDTSKTDQLVITGNTSGNSNVRVANFNGAGALTSEGIKIIQVDGLSEGAFTLNGDYALEGQQVVVAGAYAYALHKNGIGDPQDGSWYLRSQLIPAPEQPTQPESPLYQAGIPVYEAYAQGLLTANRLPTLQQRVGNRYWSSANAQESGDTESASAVWGRIEGSHSRFEPKTTTTLDNYDVDV